MFENFSYKQKLIALAVVFVMLLLVANKRSFRTTKESYRQMKEVESQLKYMQATTHNSKELQKQVQVFDGLIGKQNIETHVVQQSILNFANKYPGINVEELTETHSSAANGFEITTNQLILEGDFQSLTEVVYEYEKKFKESSLVSVNFTKEKDYGNRKNRLTVQLIFQNYEKTI